MNWNGIRLFAFDLDGTVIEGERLGGEAPFLLAEFVRRDGVAVVASGRMLESQIRFLRESGIYPGRGFPQYLVPAGKYVYALENGEYVPDRQWNDALRARWQASCDQLAARAPDILAGLETRGVRARMVADDAWRREQGFFALVCDSPAAAAEAVRLMTEAFEDIGGIAITRNLNFAYAMPDRAGKGHALRHVARGLGIAAAEILAIGDSLNDLGMLDGRFGFRSATIANAEPEIKEAVRANGGHVSGGAVAAGFCEVLSRVVAATDSAAVSR